MSYFDTSLLVPLYIEERGSGVSASRVRALVHPIPLTFLHEVELSNALHRPVFQRRISADRALAASQWYADDIAAGLFQRAVDGRTLVRQSNEISRSMVANLGARSLVVMHVAMAEMLGADAFATADDRQRELAQKRGLQTV